MNTTVNGQIKTLRRPVHKTDYEFVQTYEGIEKRPIQYNKVTIEVDGELRDVLRPFHPDEYELILNDEENQIQRKLVKFEYFFDENHNRIRRSIVEDEFEYDEVEDDDTGEIKLNKRKVDYQIINMKLDDGNVHLVKKKIEPDFYCFIQVDVDGTKKVERRKMCIEKVAQQKVNGDIRIVRRPFIPEEYDL